MAKIKNGITTISDLNQALTKALAEIVKTGSSTKGNSFDNAVRVSLIKHLVGANFIHGDRWCSKDKNSIFFMHKNRTLNYNFDFTDLPPLVDNNNNTQLMIVDKPNGSQKWPDLLVIFNGIGLPIEIKSAKQDVILWNSGLPREGSLYIYNCYGKLKTTYFLGEHAVSNDELEFLLEKSKLAAKFNEREKNGKWSFYVRDMFNSNQRYFENDEVETTCIKLQNTIYNNENLIKTLKESNSKKDERKAKSLEHKTTKLTESLIKLKSSYIEEQKDRIQTEKETIDFITGLTWDSVQKTNFSINNSVGNLKDNKMESPSELGDTDNLIVNSKQGKLKF